MTNTNLKKAEDFFLERAKYFLVDVIFSVTGIWPLTATLNSAYKETIDDWAAHCIYDELFQPKFTFADVDDALQTAAADRKYWFGFPGSPKNPLAPVEYTAEGLADLLAAACKLVNITWDVTNKTDQEMQKINSTIFGKALQEAGCLVGRDLNEEANSNILIPEPPRTVINDIDVYEEWLYKSIC